MNGQRKKPAKVYEGFEEHKQAQFGQILKKVTAFKKKASDDYNVTTVSEAELRRKLSQASTPMIIFQGWSSSTSSPGSINYTVGITNPDPVQHSSMFAHLFIGPANMVRVTGRALAPVDTRFPRLTEPSFFGLSLAPGATQSLNFTIDVPANIEASNYLGNTFLFRADWHDVGDYLDRSIFVFQVT